jgi:hypothetical protein
MLKNRNWTEIYKNEVNSPRKYFYTSKIPFPKLHWRACAWAPFWQQVISLHVPRRRQLLQLS